MARCPYCHSVVPEGYPRCMDCDKRIFFRPEELSGLQHHSEAQAHEPIMPKRRSNSASSSKPVHRTASKSQTKSRTSVKTGKRGTFLPALFLAIVACIGLFQGTGVLEQLEHNFDSAYTSGTVTALTPQLTPEMESILSELNATYVEDSIDEDSGAAVKYYYYDDQLIGYSYISDNETYIATLEYDESGNLSVLSSLDYFGFREYETFDSLARRQSYLMVSPSGNTIYTESYQYTGDDSENYTCITTYLYENGVTEQMVTDTVEDGFIVHSETVYYDEDGLETDRTTDDYRLDSSSNSF